MLELVQQFLDKEDKYHQKKWPLLSFLVLIYNLFSLVSLDKIGSLFTTLIPEFSKAVIFEGLFVSSLIWLIPSFFNILDPIDKSLSSSLKPSLWFASKVSRPVSYSLYALILFANPMPLPSWFK